MLRFVKGSLRQLSYSWIQLRLGRKSSSRKIRFSRLLQGIDQPHEFLHGMGQGNIVVFSFGTFLGKVFSKDRVPVTDVLGCVVEGVSQCWVFVKQFSRNDTATACQDWLRVPG